MNELRIRRALPPEHLALEALQRRASLADGLYREQLEAHPDAMAIPLEQVERGEVLVAETGGTIVGLAVVIVGESMAELDGLFVEPAYWRTGIGTALADAATHAARRAGCSLAVTAGHAARDFYSRCGFVVEGEAETRFGPALRMSR
ncbi:GNAT family N-acetyltransferase [Sphingomonas sp.]|uniref:GNAT family N-acetyltransferase n=1 Tax=Sphingomonas sp. TaxID=28214 RepID=UPI00286E6EEE|nr:GNAT family N-acetyltransferase [Sphingomonas sp.]